MSCKTTQVVHNRLIAILFFKHCVLSCLKERESVCVCVQERVCVCVCACARERVCVCVAAWVLIEQCSWSSGSWMPDVCWSQPIDNLTNYSIKKHFCWHRFVWKWKKYSLKCYFASFEWFLNWQFFILLCCVCHDSYQQQSRLQLSSRVRIPPQPNPTFQVLGLLSESPIINSEAKKNGMNVSIIKGLLYLSLPRVEISTF